MHFLRDNFVMGQERLKSVTKKRSLKARNFQYFETLYCHFLLTSV